MTPEMRAEESTWLALHALDAYQTAQIEHDPGVHEAESRWIIGAKPSKMSVASYFAAVAATHVGIAAWISAHHWPTWTLRAFEVVTIADSGHCVVVNYRLGLR